MVIKLKALLKYHYKEKIHKAKEQFKLHEEAHQIVETMHFYGHLILPSQHLNKPKKSDTTEGMEEQKKTGSNLNN